MPTKTFSGRADEQRLAYADMLAQRAYGISYAQYCSSVLLAMVCERHELPSAARTEDASREDALRFCREFPSLPHDEAVGAMGDGEIRELIAGRYA